MNLNWPPLIAIILTYCICSIQPSLGPENKTFITECENLRMGQYLCPDPAYEFIDPETQQLHGCTRDNVAKGFNNLSSCFIFYCLAKFNYWFMFKSDVKQAMVSCVKALITQHSGKNSHASGRKLTPFPLILALFTYWIIDFLAMDTITTPHYCCPFFWECLVWIVFI